jgi:outer membrane protein assembly factor BamD
MNTRSFFPSTRSAALAGIALASLVFAATANAQVTGSTTTSTDANGQNQTNVTVSAPLNKKDDKVVQTKDTKQELRKEKKLAPVDAGLPDKVLYDKALDATKRGHFDVARLDLQTLLNTYPDSQYLMKAKLAIADSWFKEGGTAALTQAEQEYKDFETFFPNAPEAAEAQMRVGDIYFREMDKPDRDYAKALHAEEEYRLMLQQYPESTLVPQAKQRLREVQEVMATRESEIAAFYSTHNNWPATIARYQTVVDTYPQYSRMDDVLIGLGDAYETEARYVRSLKGLPEAGKARLEKTYDDLAIAAYSRVVLEHAASSHVEDARDRLDAMNVPIPTPTPAQVAASVALENSRRQYRLQDRAVLLVMHRPDTVPAARNGDPTLTDPAPTLAPHITSQIESDFKGAFAPPGSASGSAPAGSKPAATADATATTDAGAQPATTDAAAPAAAPLQFQDVPKADAVVPSGSAVITNVQGNTPPPAASGNSMGVEILTPGANGQPADNGGLKAVGPANATPLPAPEKPAAAPEQVNDVAEKPQPAAQAPNANGKNGKPEFDKSDESSSKHKKKKGLSKLNPF